MLVSSAVTRIHALVYTLRSRQRPGSNSNRFGRTTLFALVGICACFISSRVSAQGSTPAGNTPPASQNIGVAQGPKSAVVTSITSKIAVDGVLDEPVWETSPSIGELTQRDPRPGGTPTERTEIKLLHDAETLYVGVMCYDSEPQRIISTLMARDSSLSNTDDWIEMLLDTYHDRRNAFYFATNPAGALVDGLITANGSPDTAWDAIWTVRTRRTDQGWSAEFAIPFKSLSFPAGQTTWGFNIARHIARKQYGGEDDRWSGSRLELQFYQVSEEGDASLDGMTQGIGLDIRPFAASSWTHTVANDNTTAKGKPGLDMFYDITPSLKLTTTANTDFGETEVDARQINLTRFPLVFPEKRTFFLEDLGVFSFASTATIPAPGFPATGADVYPFFSRQIGLLAGQEVPVDFGAKLTGKVGRTNLGVLDVRTGDESGIVSAKNVFVGRVKQNFLRQSYIGAIVTEGNPAGPLSSSTFGADARLATSRLFGQRKTAIITAYGLKSLNEGNSGEDWSYGVAAQYPNDLIDAQFIWRETQKNFQPAVGFVQRRNVDMLRVGAQYEPRPKDFLNLTQIQNGVYYTRFTNLDDGKVESSDLYFTLPIDWHFKTGDAVHRFFDPDFVYERLSAPFQIFPGVVLPVGEYRFTRLRFHYVSASKRRLSGSVQYAFGTYWSGHAQEVIPSLTYKLPPNFTLTLNGNYTFADLPQGRFVARLLSGRVDYATSPFLTFSSLMQYDNQSRNLGWQSRMRWTLQPGNDLFLVFNQGWIQEQTNDPFGAYRFRAQSSKLSTKLQYTFRF